jgi:hypothetical protein
MTKATTVYDYVDSKRDQASKVAKKRDAKK